MEAKARKFIQSLGQRLADQQIENNQLESILREAISSLPEKQSKLKNGLTQSFQEHLAVFSRFFPGKQPVKSSYITSSHEHSVDPSLTLIQEIFQNGKNPTKVMEIVNSVTENCSKNIPIKLCQVALVSHSSVVTQCVANALYRHFDVETNRIINAKKSIYTSHELKNVILNACVLFQSNIRPLNQDDAVDNLPSFSDILAALYSLFVDVCIFDSSEDEIKIGQAGNRLIETSEILLGKDVDRMLDALIQLSTLQQPNAHHVLVPLYKHIMSNNTWLREELSEERYLRYMMMIRQAINVVKGHSDKLVEEFKSAGLNTAAPKYFYEWVIKRKGGRDLLDTTPFLATTKPASLTKFFVLESEMETLDDFLDLCLVGQEIPDDEAREENVNPSDDNDDKELLKNEDLFFIDKPDSSPTYIDQLMEDTNKIIESAVEDKTAENSDDEFLKDTEFLLKTVSPLKNPAEDSSGVEILSQQEENLSTNEDANSFGKHDDNMSLSNEKTNITSPTTKLQSSRKVRQRKLDSSTILSPIAEDSLYSSKPAKRLQSQRRVLSKKDVSDSESSTASCDRPVTRRSKRLSESSANNSSSDQSNTGHPNDVRTTRTKRLSERSISESSTISIDSQTRKKSKRVPEVKILHDEVMGLTSDSKGYMTRSRRSRI